MERGRCKPLSEEDFTHGYVKTDMQVAETPKDGLKEYIKVDPDTDWLKKEGVRVYEEYYFPSLAKIELGPWERKGGSGAVVHIKTQPRAQ